MFPTTASLFASMVCVWVQSFPSHINGKSMQKKIFRYACVHCDKESFILTAFTISIFSLRQYIVFLSLTPSGLPSLVSFTCMTPLACYYYSFHSYSHHTTSTTHAPQHYSFYWHSYYASFNTLIPSTLWILNGRFVYIICSNSSVTVKFPHWSRNVDAMMVIFLYFI